MRNRYSYKGRHRRPTRNLAVAAVARPAVVIAAAATVSFGVIAPAGAHTGDHTVGSGDTLNKLAASHGTSWRAIYADNRDTIGANPNVLRIGQVLTVGGSGSRPSSPSQFGGYVVRAGDTLSAIAARHGITWQQLYAINREAIGANPNVVQIGQRLVVNGEVALAATPGPAAAPSAASERASRGSARPSSGDARTMARAMVADRGWSSGQFTCLNSLWTRESNWNPTADNPTSSAYGIPQALPGSKMASAGADWRTNPATQITWGLGYIADRYGDPCAAWSHFQANNWY